LVEMTSTCGGVKHGETTKPLVEWMCIPGYTVQVVTMLQSGKFRIYVGKYTIKNLLSIQRSSHIGTVICNQ
jgi:hypothetical protein